MSGGKVLFAGRLSVLLQWRLVVFVFLIRIELAKYSVSFGDFFSLSLANEYPSLSNAIVFSFKKFSNLV
jgi:hypothetical protein